MSGYPPVSPPATNSVPYPTFPNPIPYPASSPYPGNQQNHMMESQVQPGFRITGTYPFGGNQSQPEYPCTGTYPVGSNQSQPGYPSTYPVGDNQRQPGFPSAATFPIGGYPNASAGSPLPVTIPAVSPTAPDMSDIKKIPGYERITFQEEIVQPPVSPTWQPEQQEQKQFENLPSITEEQVREAAGQFVSEHCCYGSAVVRNMDIKEISMKSALHYKLETFTEKRASSLRFVPFKGQAIDGPMNGPAPAIWEIHATPNSYFSNGKKKLEVPHTAFVKPCHTCVGNGRIRCDSCIGNGRRQCILCRGRGRRRNANNDEMCNSCHGTGFDRCFTCTGTGQVKCETCSGKGNLKGFVELKITWTNHTDDYISETQNMPKKLVRKVSGQVVFEEKNPRVHPISNYSDKAVNNASKKLVTEHSRAFTNERILKQRHCLRLIPIAEVTYEWKGRLGEFYVYGYEHKVYFSDYPQKCCCCSIF